MSFMAQLPSLEVHNDLHSNTVCTTKMPMRICHRYRVYIPLFIALCPAYLLCLYHMIFLVA